ncbi:type II secretion system F family protein [Occallatibacter riparius]|uniref:Type II secretion system F family protein n=1 Tax=Occallatibacter riparius TaxID=1002689 RepID=A0A9J7BJJ7_9BACT|nr:type II secretion system F family protein [Occallatibacter riparius]UWZ83076.1 type II secretion system F family protein [Occallatibacter riparius]
MSFAIIVFLSVFLLIGSLGFLLFYREAMVQRIAAVVFDRPQRSGIAGTIEKAGESLGVVLEKVEKVVPKSQSEISVIQQRLVRAGFRKESAMKYFYASKAITPLIFCVLLSFTEFAKDSPFIFYAGGLGLGYLAPDFWLGRKIKKRQEEISRSLPDVLDLLVICLEAGLGMDQATTRTTTELASTHPIISDELDLIVLEQRAGRPRSDCWRHMADRTDVDLVRNLVSTMVQAEQFGTSIAKTLRTHSDTMRTQRIQQVEEQAAKTTIKLIFPLVLFIFPCMFIVTIGPAIIVIQEQFKNLFNQ